MRRKQRHSLWLRAFLMVAVGLPCWLTWREVRQFRLDHELIAAIKRDDVHCVVSLLEQGADANARDIPADRRPFWQAVCDLLRGGRKPAPQTPSALLTALRVQHRVVDLECGSEEDVPTDTTPIVQSLLARGADAHIRADNGDTPLIMAARSGSLGTVRLLLDHSADVNAANDGHTALMEAICWGDEDNKDNLAVCELLLQRGANPNIQRAGDHFTPLMSAMYGHHQYAALLLLRWKADVNVGWKAHTKTALDCAYYHLPSFVSILKAAGAKESEVDKGDTK